MPSTTKKQHNLMAACSTDKGRSKMRGKCPPKKVAEEFMHADKGKKFKKKPD